MTLRFLASARDAIAASTRSVTTVLFSGSLTAIVATALIAVVSVSGAQQQNFKRQTVARRAQEIARMLIAAPPQEASAILGAAAEPDLTVTVERPSRERRRYLESEIARYIRPPPAARLGDVSRDAPDLAGQEYHPDNDPVMAAREALHLAPRPNLAYVLEGAGDDFWRVSIPVNDGQWLSVEAKRGTAVPEDFPRLAGLFIGIAIAIAIASIVALQRLTQPLRQLESAAINFGRDLDSPPLAEEGPGDIRRVAHAFNQMRDQLRRFVGDRTTMLAAISHDLRSPLQRLRFRADFMTDDEQREKMLRDLRDMESMIAATLDFARADADNEPTRMHDLSHLLRTVAESLGESGYRVSVGGTPAHLSQPCCAPCRARALRRAVENLAVNAATYGGAARLSIDRDAGSGTIAIIVDDDGPGLPDADLERVFAPFFRMESSRNADTGGTGLGLSIARSIARSHGGDVRLANRPGGGLQARLTLPS